MTPLHLLLLTLLLTALAYAGSVVMHQRVSRQLQVLARQWHMHYSPRDQLRLASRVAQAFPIPGAANLRVTDLVYGLVGERHLFIFTAEYTVGVLRAKHRIMRVVSFSERKDQASAEHATNVQLAPDNQSLIEQYKTMSPEDR